jgi:sulfate permease, SulP family
MATTTQTEASVDPERARPGPIRPLNWLSWEIFFQRVPALDALRTYSWQSLRLDLSAGLTVAAVAVPQAMAYATIAGLHPMYGLYTAIVMTFVGAIFDSSRQLINGPTNAISIALFSALATVPEDQKAPAAVLMAMLVGIVQTAITLMRLGDLTRFVSQGVIVGFTVGASVLLVLDQLKNLLGLPAVGSPEDHFLVRFFETNRHLDKINPYAVALGLGTILLVMVLRWLGRRLLGVRLPELLIAVAAMAWVVWYFELEERGIRVTGNIPAQLPGFALPAVSWAWIHQLSASSLALALLGLLEALAMAKAIAARTRQKLDLNQQCLSEGLANLAGSFFHCFPGSGSLTRSAINVQAGAVSQWSGVFAALAVAACTVLLAPLAYYVPRPALAGLLMLASTQLVDRKQLLYHVRTTRFDAVVVWATAIAAVAISVEFCILIGVFLSFVLYVHRAARLHLSELVLTPERVLRERTATDSRCGRILIFALEGELFFGSVHDLSKHFDTLLARMQDGIKVLVLRVKRVRNPDAVCLEELEHFNAELERRGIVFLLCGVRPDFTRVLNTSGLRQRLGEQSIFRETDVPTSSTLDAVRHAYDLLGEDICTNCPRRGEIGKETLYYMI